MIADGEAKNLMTAYADNDSLLGKIKLLNATQSRLETAGHFATVLHESLKKVLVASKQLKTVLSKSKSFKGSKKFSDRIDYIQEKLDLHEEGYAEYIGDIGMLATSLNSGDYDDDDDGDDDNTGGSGGCGGGGPSSSAFNELVLCSVPTDDVGREKEKETTTARYENQLCTE